MQNGFNSIQESSLEMTLTGLRQDKYIQLFNKKGCTKFDTFVNMDEADLLNVGITDDKDRQIILDGIDPLKQLYKDINEFSSPDLDMVIGNNIHHLRTHLGSLIILRRELIRNRPRNTLIDSTHSAVNALSTLLEILKTQIDYIEDDLIIGKMEENKNKRSGIKKILYIGLFASSFTFTTIAVTKYFGINILEKVEKLKYFGRHFI